jgi:hypothetical protein
MFILNSGDITVSARTGHVLFKKARARNVDFTNFKVYSDETLIVDCSVLNASNITYGMRDNSVSWQAGFSDAIGNIRLFLDTHRLRNNGKIPTTITPLVVMN